MKKQIFHGRSEETPEAKARWFQSLPLRERMELLDSYSDMILEINPGIVEQKRAQSVKGSIRVVSKP